MRKESDAEKIIHSAPLEMQGMLRSVFHYCSPLLLKWQEKLLERILFAMVTVDRKFFVEEGRYLDAALHIGKGQTISQPSTVAAMLLYADIHEGDRILEIGSGSGWNACLLSFLAYPGKVISLERYISLSERARRNVANLKRYLQKKNLRGEERIQPVFLAENILEKGSVWKKKYHKILFTAGIVGDQEKMIEEIALALLLQGGILVCPRVSGNMIIFKKNKTLVREETKEAYVFVPLKEGVEK